MPTEPPVTPGTAYLLTPQGVGAIAVVRLVGPHVHDFLARHFTGNARPDRCVHGLLKDRDDAIDDVIVVLHSIASRSVADIHLHGGRRVVERCLELASNNPFLIVPRAIPGAGSRDSTEASDAPLEDEELPLEMADPLERDALALLPLARTRLALRVLLAQPQALRRFLDDPRRHSKGADRARWLEEAKRIVEDRSLHWLLHPPRVALVGRANVGKSTLANRLFGRSRSITADLPGTTRDAVAELADLDGLMVHLIDTPGVRDTDDPIEKLAIEKGAEVATSADLIVLVLDAANRELDAERKLLARHPRAIVMLNKCDRELPTSPGEGDALRSSALLGTGIDDLESAVRVRFGWEAITPELPRCVNDRQREWIKTRDE